MPLDELGRTTREEITMTEICMSALTQGAVCLREVSSGICLLLLLDFLGGSVVKNPPAKVGDAGSVPELGRSPGEGNDPLRLVQWFV